METVLPHSEPYIPKAIVNGLISTVILWAFWTPFIVFLAIPLVAAQLKDGICMGLNDNYSIPQIPLKTNATASQNLMNKDPEELKDANAKLTYTFIFTSIIVMTLCLYVAYRIIVGYNLNFKNILLFNIVMALIIVTIEMSFFTGVSMRYLPFIPTDVIGSVASDVSGYYNELNTPTNINSDLTPSAAIATPYGTDGMSYSVRWTPPSANVSNITYSVQLYKTCATSSDPQNWRAYKTIASKSFDNVKETDIFMRLEQQGPDSPQDINSKCVGPVTVWGSVCVNADSGRCADIMIL